MTLRYDSRLRHIGLGREHARRRVDLRIADFDVRVIDAETGKLLRELALDPTKDYQPLRPATRTPATASPKCNDVPTHVSTVSRDIATCSGGRI